MPGVAEVASVGGFEKQYQVEVDPVRLQAFNIPITRVMAAVSGSNAETGARVLEVSGREYMIRAVGYAKGITDLENAVVSTTAGGTPIRVRDVAHVQIGPEIRRGAADWNGRGEVVGGIVIMRFGENARSTIEQVKARLAEVQGGLQAQCAALGAADDPGGRLFLARCSRQPSTAHATRPCPSGVRAIIRPRRTWLRSACATR